MGEFPIIALWSHPRSMSTAIERVMRERGDLRCAHEPFMYDYYVHRKIRKMPHFDVQPDHPVTYDRIRDQLLNWADNTPVFFKDMSYYVMPHILEDPTFCDRVTHCFLVRDPLVSILSYFKLDPEVTRDEIGLEAQWNHYKGLVDRGNKPTILSAEDIRADARGVIGALWQKIGLPHVAKAFDWQSPQPEDWQQVGGWHSDVSKAQGIRPVDQDEVDKKTAEFKEMARQHPDMQRFLDHHLPYHQKLKDLAE